jgi:capsid protein
MGLLNKTLKAIGLTKLKYDAVTPSKRRHTVTVPSKPADRELTIEQRQSFVSQTREIQGNFAIAEFLIDKHIQYMASYRFQCKTANDEFNKAVEKLFKRWMRRESCDVTGEFSFAELLQMIELHRTADGDVLIVKHGRKGQRRDLTEIYQPVWCQAKMPER